MDFMDSRYCRTLRNLFSWIGVWPYDRSIFAIMLKIILSGTFLYCTLIQWFSFLTAEYKADVLLQVLSFSLITFIYFVKYNAIVIKAKDIKETIERIQHEWTTLKRKECKILEKYAEATRWYIIIIAGSSYASAIVFILIEIVPDVLNAVMLLNNSHVRELPYTMDCLCDMEKYFYVFPLLICVTILAGTATMVSTQAATLLFVSHATGLFKITCHRIENIFEESMRHHLLPQRNSIISAKILNAVYMYKNAIEFTNFTVTIFEYIDGISILLGCINTCLSMYQLSQSILDSKSLGESVFWMLLIGTFFIYALFYGYIGQTLTDHSCDVFRSLCNTQWYMFPLPAQKLLFMFMQRTMKSYVYVLNGILIMSLESMSGIANLSVSYFMVIYSTY